MFERDNNYCTTFIVVCFLLVAEASAQDIIRLPQFGAVAEKMGKLAVY